MADRTVITSPRIKRTRADIQAGVERNVPYLRKHKPGVSRKGRVIKGGEHLAQKKSRKAGSVARKAGGFFGRNPVMGAAAFGLGFVPDVLLRRESESIPYALARGAGYSALAGVMGGKAFFGLMLGPPLARAAVSGIPSAFRQQESNYNQLMRPNLGGNYQDTQQALTMRQAGVQAIQQSKMNARSALGTEASRMHR